jgi:hypothetical protein
MGEDGVRQPSLVPARVHRHAAPSVRPTWALVGLAIGRPAAKYVPQGGVTPPWPWRRLGGPGSAAKSEGVQGGGASVWGDAER